MSIKKMAKEKLQEMALVEIAYGFLQEKKKPVEFKALLAEVASLLGVAPKRMEERMVQFYTDLNIDGRFTSIDRLWGLKAWYPVDQIEEEVTLAPKTRKKAKKVDKEADDGFDEIDIEDDGFDEFDGDESETELDEESDLDNEDSDDEEPEEREESIEVSLSEVEEKERAADEEDEELV